MTEHPFGNVPFRPETLAILMYKVCNLVAWNVVDGEEVGYPKSLCLPEKVLIYEETVHV